MPETTVLLATNLPPDGNRHALRRAWRGWTYYYETEAGYDEGALSDRARAMLAASGRRFTTFLDGDDMTNTLHRRRRSVGIVEAASLLAQGEGERAQLTKRAEAYFQAYGDESCGARVETIEFVPPLASADDLRDATGYLNQLAAIPGLGVREWFNAPTVWLDDFILDVGAAPWEFMLRQGVRRFPAAKASPL